MMHDTDIDIAGIPTTLAIIAVMALIVLVLRYFNKKHPQALETFKDWTPWMGWVEDDDDEYYYQSHTVRYRIPRQTENLNRWK